MPFRKRIEKRIEVKGHEPTLHDSTSFPIALHVNSYDAVIVAASLHQSKYQPSVVQFIEENLDSLTDRPTAFVSVSLSAVLDENEAHAQACVDRLIDQTGWHPTTNSPIGAPSTSSPTVFWSL